MALKFMQRRQSDAKPSPASVATPTPPKAASAAAAVTTTPLEVPPVEPQRSEFEWTLAPPEVVPASNGAPPPPRVTNDEDVAAQVGPTTALIQFRAGRRSFGSFNPRLEKRLAEIRTNQRAAVDELADAARADKESRRRQAEHAELVRRAEADEALERRNAVSDAELAGHFAAKYGRYVPAPRPALAPPLDRSSAHAPPNPPPEADYPVQVSDAPLRKMGKAPRRHDSGSELHGVPGSKKVRR